jgi:hypothetical protein
VEPYPVRSVSGAVLVLLFGAWTGVVPSGGTAVVEEDALLREIGFSAQEVQRITRGEVVARTTQADSSAVALAVAATVTVPPAFYLDQLRDIASFKKGPEIQQLGRFGRDPSTADLATLVLDQSDVDDLRTCKAGNCGVKLDANGIRAMASREARIESASSAMRGYLAAYVQRYLQAGNPALIEYHDASRPKRLRDDLLAITERLPFLRRGWPVLFEGITQFNGLLPNGLDGFVYWSKEKIGPRAVVSVTHVVIQPMQNGTAAVGTKQLYASHYGHASLGLTILLDKGTPESPRTRVIYVNRSRLDIFGGLFGGIKRPLVRSRARDVAERTIRQLRERLERNYRAGVRS